MTATRHVPSWCTETEHSSPGLHFGETYAFVDTWAEGGPLQLQLEQDENASIAAPLVWLSTGQGSGVRLDLAGAQELARRLILLAMTANAALLEQATAPLVESELLADLSMLSTAQQQYVRDHLAEIGSGRLTAMMTLASGKWPA